MPELFKSEYAERNYSQVRSLDSALQVSPEEIPAECDPMLAPQNFYKWLVKSLEHNGDGLIPPENPGLYEPTELMVFCGFDATALKDSGSFGEKRETWGIEGGEFKKNAQQAEETGEWPIHSPVWYASNQNNRDNTPEIPAIAVFDGAKMFSLINQDKTRHQDEYGVAEGFSMDEAAVAVIYLPRN